MESLMDALMGQLSGDNLNELSRQLNADEKTTETALAASLPLLLSALERNSMQPEGAQSLYSALERDHDGSLLDDPQGYLRSPDYDDGRGIMRHAFGAQQGGIMDALSQKTGLSREQIGQLLAFAAPLVLAWLGRQRQQQQVQPQGLPDILQRERVQAQEQAQQRNPGLGDLLSTILGGGGLGGLLGGSQQQSGGRQQSGGLGDLLGGNQAAGDLLGGLLGGNQPDSRYNDDEDPQRGTGGSGRRA